MSPPTFDLLLEYVSALGRGTWQTFRAAATLVGVSQRQGEAPRWLPTAVAENLAALGHVEFAFDTSLDWVVGPAAIAGAPALGPGRGILCGSRTSSTIEAVEAAARDVGAECVRVAQDLAPSVVEVRAGNDHQLAALASRAGLAYEPDVASRLGRCLPSLASLYRVAPEAALPLGFPIYRFEVATMDWSATDEAGGDGSFFFDSYRPEHRVITNGVAKKVSRSVAVYAALARAQKVVATYVADAKELTLPARARPPILYSRALVLSSGRLPAYDAAAGTHRFSYISSGLAAAVRHGLEKLEDDSNG